MSTNQTNQENNTIVDYDNFSEEELLVAVSNLIDNVDQSQAQLGAGADDGADDGAALGAAFDDDDADGALDCDTNLEEKYSEENTSSCSVCYKDLTVNNIVNTMCNHVYCKTCFFKWMKQGYNCPMCRRNFISMEQWYQGNSVNTEIANETRLSQKLQLDSIVMSKECRKLQKINDELSFWNKQKLRRQISLRQQIEYSEGYIVGLNDSQTLNKYDRKINFESSSNSPWFHGFTKGMFKCAEMDLNKRKDREKFERKYDCQVEENQSDSSDVSMESFENLDETKCS